MLWSTDNVDDIRRYYLNTYVKLPTTGDRIWYVKRVNDTYVEMVDADGFDKGIVPLDEPFEVGYVIPKRTVYQYKNMAAFLVRHPAKQYNRGLSEKNTRIAYLDADNRWRSMAFTAELIQEFVDKPAYQNPYLAVNDPSLTSVALDPCFSMHINSGVIYLHQQSVGCYIKESNTVKGPALLQPELSKLFAKSVYYVK